MTARTISAETAPTTYGDALTELARAWARIEELEQTASVTWTEVQADRKRTAERIAHLEEMLAAAERIADDQAKLIRDQKAERDQLRSELEGARVIINAREARLNEAEAALNQRTLQLRTANAAYDHLREEMTDLDGRLRDIQAILSRP